MVYGECCVITLLIRQTGSQQRTPSRGTKAWVPQLIGVAPEKAIKLVVNDYLRGWFQKPNPNPNNTGRKGGGTSGQDVFFPLGALAGCGVSQSPSPTPCRHDCSPRMVSCNASQRIMKTL